MNFKKFWILLASMAMMLVSCVQKEDDSTISLELKWAVVSYTEGRQFVTVKADGEWSLELKFEDGVEPWAELNHASGRGDDYSVILSYKQNGGDRRVLTLVLTSGQRQYEFDLVQTAYTAAAAPMYMELPAFVPDDDYVFNTHRMQFNGGSFRNYSYYYSMDDKVSLWVAYPLNKALIGSGRRTDAWAADPFLPESCQAYIWTGGYGGYDRGHQLPSADRLTPGANEMTFYATNMTPQVGADFNQTIWADLESKVRGFSGASKSDTLYVVTGCVVKGSTRTARWNTTVPTHHYKALLRYKPGANNTVDGSGYNAIAMYMENKSYDSKTFTKEYVMSIRELEKLTGIDFFVNLKDYVGQETYDKIENQDPLTLKAVWGF